MNEIFVNPVGYKFRDNYYRFKLGLRQIKNKILFDAPPPVYSMLSISPKSITTTISWTDLEERGSVPTHEHFQKVYPEIAGTVVGGSWDQSLRNFESDIVYQSLIVRFDEGKCWSDTQLFQSAVERINQGETWWGCQSEDDFKARCEQIDRLFTQIRTEGYKTQQEIADETPYLTITRDNPVNQILEGEISVHIGRDGDFIFHDGRHRLSIAKILGLESIPVVVLVRHQKWQELRDRVSGSIVTSGNLSREYKNHKDIKYLVK